MTAIVAPNKVNSIGLPIRRLLLMEDESHAVPVSDSWAVFQVIVPSNYGGWLTVGLRKEERQDRDEIVMISADGHVVEVDDVEKFASAELPEGRRGSGSFLVYIRSPSGKSHVYAFFDEIGYARESDGEPLVPWNFWYFPFSPGEKPWETAWATEVHRPLQKYEEAFGETGAFAWEMEHHADTKGEWPLWAGHCDAAAAASMLFEAPQYMGKEHAGVHFTEYEIKFLATEVAGARVNEVEVWSLPDQPPALAGALRRQTPADAPDVFGTFALVGFLATLRRYIRGEGEPLRVDLGAMRWEAAPGFAEAVWNHAVFCYEIRYCQFALVPPEFVDLRVRVYANADTLRQNVVDRGLPGRFVRRLGALRFEPETDARALDMAATVELTPDGEIIVGGGGHRWWSATSRDSHSWRRPGKVATFVPRQAFRIHSMWEQSVSYPAKMGNPHVETRLLRHLVELRRRYR